MDLDETATDTNRSPQVPSILSEETMNDESKGAPIQGVLEAVSQGAHTSAVPEDRQEKGALGALSETFEPLVASTTKVSPLVSSSAADPTERRMLTTPASLVLTTSVLHKPRLLKERFAHIVQEDASKHSSTVPINANMEVRSPFEAKSPDLASVEVIEVYEINRNDSSRETVPESPMKSAVRHEPENENQTTEDPRGTLMAFSVEVANHDACTEHVDATTTVPQIAHPVLPPAAEEPLSSMDGTKLEPSARALTLFNQNKDVCGDETPTEKLGVSSDPDTHTTPTITIDADISNEGILPTTDIDGINPVSEKTEQRAEEHAKSEPTALKACLDSTSLLADVLQASASSHYADSTDAPPRVASVPLSISLPFKPTCNEETLTRHGEFELADTIIPELVIPSSSQHTELAGVYIPAEAEIYTEVRPAAIDDNDEVRNLHDSNLGLSDELDAERSWEPMGVHVNASNVEVEKDTFSTAVPPFPALVASAATIALPSSYREDQTLEGQTTNTLDILKSMEVMESSPIASVAGNRSHFATAAIIPTLTNNAADVPNTPTNFPLGLTDPDPCDDISRSSADHLAQSPAGLTCVASTEGLNSNQFSAATVYAFSDMVPSDTQFHEVPSANAADALSDNKAAEECLLLDLAHICTPSILQTRADEAPSTIDNGNDRTSVCLNLDMTSPHGDGIDLPLGSAEARSELPSDSDHAHPPAVPHAMKVYGQDPPADDDAGRSPLLSTVVVEATIDVPEDPDLLGQILAVHNTNVGTAVHFDKDAIVPTPSGPPGVSTALSNCVMQQIDSSVAEHSIMHPAEPIELPDLRAELPAVSLGNSVLSDADTQLSALTCPNDNASSAQSHGILLACSLEENDARTVDDATKPTPIAEPLEFHTALVHELALPDDYILASPDDDAVSSMERPIPSPVEASQRTGVVADEETAISNPTPETTIHLNGLSQPDSHSSAEPIDRHMPDDDERTSQSVATKPASAVTREFNNDNEDTSAQPSGLPATEILPEMFVERVESWDLPDLPPSSLPCSQASDPCTSQQLDEADQHDVYNRDTEDGPLGNAMDESLSDIPVLESVGTPHEPLGEDPPPPSSLPSSQPRFSSPDRIFSSPPPDYMDSPPSSPQLAPSMKDKDAEMDMEMLCDDTGPVADTFTVLGKRSRSTSPTAFTSTEDEGVRFLKRLNKGRSPSPIPPPQPKRPTAASLKNQFKKLIKPFRSPLVKVEDILAGKEGIYASAHAHLRRAGPSSVQDEVEEGQDVSQEKVNIDENDSNQHPNKHYSARVAKQFKSPFAAPGSVSQTASSSTAASGTLFSSVKATPNIQVLQAKVQKLKQAIKIKNEHSRGDEQNLEALVTKWRTAGRDIAWLVWDTVKDLDVGEGLNATPNRGGWDGDEFSQNEKGQKGKGGGFDSGWGFQSNWGHDDVKKTDRDGFDTNWGWDDPSKTATDDTEEVHESMEVDEDEERPSQTHSLGTMLRHLGIDPETLGWDEDEGDFVGEP